METSGGCYCCVRPTATSMDLDTALNELGMLSTVTESRHQYLRESRSRAKSESEKESVSNVAASGCSSQEQDVVPGGYQVLKMNPKYIVGLTSSPKQDIFHSRGRSMSAPVSTASTDLGFFSRAGKFSKNSMEVERKTSRVARVKLSRIRRYQQPYNLPWWLNKSLSQESTGPVASTSTYSSSLDGATGLKTDSELSQVEGLQFAFHRSKSMNDLTLAKLSLGTTTTSSSTMRTAEGHSDDLTKGSGDTQGREIDSVSEHLQELHVNDDESMLRISPLFCNT
ncbi:uncharacterized protein LOC135503300 [Lineus longissimus]|uniref:uncharacterized protein LOC135503300 n=1 Tax=Lineus longissimus TaxID=88925 RepID=UPI002B4EB295